ncbi:MAG: hypothetical protein GXP03_09285 [Alphaproteobacteria bacterium]|nr:hypothetical protein [Alphaproteobacteria bacterium]
MTDSTQTPTNTVLTGEIAALRAEVNAVNSRLNMSMSRMLGRQFLRGIAFGLGSVLGATIVVSSLIYILASIDFIPIIGEWAREIADMIKQP